MERMERERMIQELIECDLLTIDEETLAGILRNGQRGYAEMSDDEILRLHVSVFAKVAA